MLRVSELRKMGGASQGGGSKPGQYSGTVTRADPDGTTWVRFDGGEGETPCTATMSCAPGDRVTVDVEGGRAYIPGNETVPATGDGKALEALAASRRATQAATTASRMAESATKDAATANRAAMQAVSDAATARGAAGRAVSDAAAAKGAADEALEEAERASGAAASAVADAESAKQAARQASSDAATASAAASRATEDALEAKEGAAAASASATSALTQLSFVQGVVDALSDHTEDMDDYIRSHLSLTDDGLWVTLDDEGYKLLLSSTGVRVYDPIGQLASAFAERMQLGAASGIHMESAPNRLSFLTGGAHLPADTSTLSVTEPVPGEVAFIAVNPETSESLFYMTHTIVLKTMRFGKWEWFERPNGNMALKWVG